MFQDSHSRLSNRNNMLIMLFAHHDTSYFFDHSVKAILRKRQLVNFESLWNSQADWIETPNQRRNGWSGVSRLDLQNNSDLALFVKRQENHNTRTAAHPFRGIPTYRRELNSILLFHKANIPTLKPVYYGERIEHGKHQAILMTKALDDYQDMFALQKTGSEQQIMQALEKLAQEVWHMHSQGLAHYCLYPNHVFVRFINGQPKIRIIDLEKVRRDLLKTRMRLKDLDCYLRHSKSFTPEARQHFVDSYMATGKVAREQMLRQRLHTRIHI